MTRVYLPTTLSLLADAYVSGGFGAGHAAHAVTAAVREWYVEGDLEELEYAALTEAAEASLRLLAAEVGTKEAYAHRRVVVAADVADFAVLPGIEADDARYRSAVRLGTAVPMADVVSVHVDDEDARPAVADALAVLGAADLGDEDAQFALDEAESHELLWYDVTEVADLI